MSQQNIWRNIIWLCHNKRPGGISFGYVTTTYLEEYYLVMPQHNIWRNIIWLLYVFKSSKKFHHQMCLQIHLCQANSTYKDGSLLVYGLPSSSDHYHHLSSRRNHSQNHSHLKQGWKVIFVFQRHLLSVRRYMYGTSTVVWLIVCVW